MDERSISLVAKAMARQKFDTTSTAATEPSDPHADARAFLAQRRKELGALTEQSRLEKVATAFGYASVEDMENDAREIDAPEPATNNNDTDDDEIV